MNKIRLKILFASLFFFWVPSLSSGMVITSNTTWKGEILISEDILVPKGVTLTVERGAIIKIVSSESTKTDPEYMSPLTEITIRGTIRADGTRDEPVSFLKAGSDSQDGWAGLIIDGGTAYLNSCRLKDAETGIYVTKGVLEIKNSVISENVYGIVATGQGAAVNITDTFVRGNDYGVFILAGANINTVNSTIKDNRKKDFYSQKGRDYNQVKVYDVKEKTITRHYSDTVLAGETVWEGKIKISGTIRVPEGSRLIIMPGTIVEFKRKDTDGDGIGENGFFIQGVFIAKGTKKYPIFFRSAERHRRMGDWDAINIMNSDGTQNLIEYCQIEDAYRGLHFHFSNVAVNESVIRNNYRGLQFQESLVEIKGDHIYWNKSGIQSRDSDISFINNYLYNNYHGANFFRANLVVRGNNILNNLKEGLRIREGIPFVEENLFDGNRYGLMVNDSLYGEFKGNVITNNLQSGILLKNADNIVVSGNFIHGNGLNGINIQNSRAAIKGNSIAGNGERGIGVISYDGLITGNNFVKNGIYAIGLDGNMNVPAPLNWWGGDEINKIIYDKEDDPAKGKIDYSPVSKEPFIITWPLNTVSTEITWYGDINIKNRVTVLSGASLVIAPDARVLFSKGGRLKIKGKITVYDKKE